MHVRHQATRHAHQRGGQLNPRSNGTIKMVDKDTIQLMNRRQASRNRQLRDHRDGKSVDEKPGTSVLSFKVNVK